LKPEALSAAPRYEASLVPFFLSVILSSFPLYGYTCERDVLYMIVL
jgi:hypothetical protein